MKNANLLLFGGIGGAIMLLFCICSSFFALVILAPDPAPVPTPVIIRPTVTPRPQLVPQTYNLTVINRTGTSICWLYLSRSSSGSWGPDQLGSDVLSSGNRFTLYGIQSGTYDLKAETCGGKTAYEWDFRINSNISWTVYD